MEYLLYPSTNISKFGLVSAVNVYDSDQSTVLKRAETDYNFATVYMNRRIIGVPAETRVYGYENSQLALVSRMTYGFDEGNFAQESNQIISPVGHDATNFGSNLIIGRGNLTSTTRHDVTGQTATVTSRVIYDIAGSVVAQLDPLNRKVLIDYTDAFNDSQNRNAFAYPTKVYDPAGNYSEVKYRFDIGANVRAQSPAPAGNSQGKITERIYDSIGRLLKDTLTNNGAYTRYEYPANGIQSKTFSTVVDNDNDGADADDEVLSESWSDGAGRVRLSRVPHTFSGGSTATWAGTVSEYDVLGRVKRQSVPTEVDANFQPAGDDATRGFLWTYQKYDWMSRVVRKINTDGVDSPTLNDSDVLISYAGCGCAGGLVVTVEGELVPRDDQPSLSARRKQKSYSDTLGRNIKTESYNWDGSTVHSSETVSLNGKDQAVTTRKFQGVAVLNNPHQTSTITYDGHGRLKTLHKPEQRTSQNDPAYTTYNYNVDDSISSVTDARGAVTNHAYNSRELLEQVSYSVPQGSTIPVPGNTSLQYDNVGNRTQMIDQTGTKTYQYDSLSQLTSETKQFNGQNNSPTNALTLSYQYHLGGELKSITEPFGQRIDYETDKIGRLRQVTASTPIQPPPYPQPPHLLSNVEYYAFGAVKSMSYGSGATLHQSFNNRLQVSDYKVRAVPFWAQSDPNYNNMYAINMQYSYLSDGRIRYSKHITLGNPPPDSMNDGGYKYDQAGRITNATTGAEARGGTETNNMLRPYRQNFVYDVWGNVTTRDARHWARHENTQHVYSNNRESSWSYDNDGRLTESRRLFLNYNERFQYVYDAAGRLTTNISVTAPQCEDPSTTRTTWLWNDGDGQMVAKSLSLQPPSDSDTYGQRFFIRSSVLDQVISEVHSGGTRFVTYTYAFDRLLARQGGSVATWEHRDPSNALYSNTSTDEYGGTDSGGTMFDPAGSNVGASSSSTGCNNNLFDDWWTYNFGPARRGGCYLDGVEHHCGFAMRFLGEMGSLAPINQAVQVTYNGQKVWAHFRAYADGHVGYVPSNATYIGNGLIAPIGGKLRDARGGVNGKILRNDTDISRLNGANNEAHLVYSGGSFPSRRILKQAIDGCARTMFGVRLIGNLKFTTETQVGEMQFAVLDGTTILNHTGRRAMIGFPKAIETFSVYNDATKFTRSQLDPANSRSLGQAVQYDGGSKGFLKFDNAVGGSSHFSNQTFAASDAAGGASAIQNSMAKSAGFNVFNHVQIHETGNALSFLTGRDHRNSFREWSDKNGKVYDYLTDRHRQRRWI